MHRVCKRCKVSPLCILKLKIVSYIVYNKYLRSELCSGCGCAKCEHESPADQNEKIPSLKWDYKTCTIRKPTDSYGRLLFPGSHFKSAKVGL